MGRCWTQSQRTPVHYNAGETRAVGQRLGAARSEVGTVCVSSASKGLCGGGGKPPSLPRQICQSGERTVSYQPNAITR